MENSNLEARKYAVNTYESQVKRLGDELEKLVKLVSWARECMENEFMGPDSGLAYKKMGILDKDMRKLKELALTMSTAVEAKIRFDKAQKQLFESMSPEEEYESVVSYIRSLEPQKITDLIARVKPKFAIDGHPYPAE